MKGDYFTGFLRGPLLVLLCVIIVGPLQALVQGQADTLRRQINMYFDSLHYEETLPLLADLIVLSQNADDSTQLHQTYADIGYAHYHLGDFEKSYLHYRMAADIAKSRDSLNTAGYLRNIGLNYQRMGLHALALAQFQTALEFAKDKGSDRLIGDTYNSMGVLHQQSAEPRKALDVLQEALKIWISSGDSNRMARVYTNLAICFEDLGMPDSAIAYNERALAIKRRENDHTIASTLNNIGVNYLTINREDEALPYLNESFQIHKTINEPEGLAISYNNYGDYWTRKGDYSKAQQYLDSAEAILEVVISKELKIDNLAFRIKLKERTGQFKEGLAIYKTWDSLKTELYLEEKFKVQEVANLFLLREKEFEKEQLAQQATMLSFTNDNIRKTNILLLLLGGSLAVFSLISYRDAQTQKKQKRKIEQQKKEIEQKNETIKNYQVELKHRMANNLGRLQSIIKETSRNISDPEVKSELARTGKILLMSSSLERYLSGVENEKEVPLIGFLDGLIDYQRQILASEGRNIKINLEHNGEVTPAVEQVINLSLILLEWVNNGVKYAFSGISNPRIDLTVLSNNGELTITYKDNGVGYSAGHKPGTGTMLNERFAKDLGAVLVTENDNGTRHTISIHYKNQKKQ